MEAPGLTQRSHRQVTVFMAFCTACLCRIILVMGTVIGVLHGSPSLELLVEVEGFGAGGGLFGFAILL